MENEKALDVLKSAVLMEIRGQEFYKTVAKEAKSDEVRNIFEIMHNEEKLHAEFISKQYITVKEQGSGIVFDLPKMTDDSVANLILSPEIRSKLEASGFEAAAISAAIDMETRAIQVYSDFAAEASEQGIKELFLWLADWERGHLKILAELDNELKEKIWYDNQFWPF